MKKLYFDDMGMFAESMIDDLEDLKTGYVAYYGFYDDILALMECLCFLGASISSIDMNEDYEDVYVLSLDNFDGIMIEKLVASDKGEYFYLGTEPEIAYISEEVVELDDEGFYDSVECGACYKVYITDDDDNELKDNYLDKEDKISLRKIVRESVDTLKEFPEEEITECECKECKCYQCENDCKECEECDEADLCDLEIESDDDGHVHTVSFSGGSGNTFWHKSFYSSEPINDNTFEKLVAFLENL